MHFYPYVREAHEYAIALAFLMVYWSANGNSTRTPTPSPLGPSSYSKFTFDDIKKEVLVVQAHHKHLHH